MKLSTASSLLLSFSSASFISARNINQEYCALCTLVYAGSGSDLESCLENFRCDSTKLHSFSNASSCDSSCKKVFSTPDDINRCKAEHCQISEEVKKANLRGIETPPDLNAADVGILQAKDPAFVAASTTDDCNDDCFAYTGTFDDYISCVNNYCRIKASGVLSFLATKESERFDSEDLQCLDQCYYSIETGEHSSIAEYFNCAEDSCGIELDIDNNYYEDQCIFYCYLGHGSSSDFDVCISGCEYSDDLLPAESMLKDTKRRMAPKPAASRRKLLKKFGTFVNK